MKRVIRKNYRNIRAISEGLCAYHGSTGPTLYDRIASAKKLTELQSLELNELAGNGVLIVQDKGGDEARYDELAKKLAITIGADRQAARGKWLAGILTYGLVVFITCIYMHDFSRLVGALIVGTIPLILMALLGEFWAWLTGPSLYSHAQAPAKNNVAENDYDYDFYRRLDEDTPHHHMGSGKIVDLHCSNL